MIKSAVVVSIPFSSVQWALKPVIDCLTWAVLPTVECDIELREMPDPDHFHGIVRGLPWIMLDSFMQLVPATSEVAPSCVVTPSCVGNLELVIEAKVVIRGVVCPTPRRTEKHSALRYQEASQRVHSVTEWDGLPLRVLRTVPGTLAPRRGTRQYVEISVTCCKVNP